MHAVPLPAVTHSFSIPFCTKHECCFHLYRLLFLPPSLCSKGIHGFHGFHRPRGIGHRFHGIHPWSPGGKSTLVDLGPFDGHTIIKCYYSVPIAKVPSISFDFGLKYPVDWPAIPVEHCTADAPFVAVADGVESTKSTTSKRSKTTRPVFTVKEDHPVHRSGVAEQDGPEGF